jgi:flagellar export protein FliJ
MPAFKFRLAGVLRLREHMKDRKRWELRTLYERRREVANELAALEKQLADNLRNPVKGHVFTAIELQLHAEHDQSVWIRIKAKRATVRGLDENIAQKRAELVQAMQAVKSLEQLRRRQEERHWKEQNLLDQRFTDEVAQRKFVQPRARKNMPS